MLIIIENQSSEYLYWCLTRGMPTAQVVFLCAALIKHDRFQEVPQVHIEMKHQYFDKYSQMDDKLSF